MGPVVCLPTFERLQDHVRRTLCARDNLDEATTPLHRAVIVRSGRPCGLFFQVQGPRRVKSYAVWAGDEDRILYYDSNGRRIGQEQLSDAPDPLKLSA